MVNLVDNARFLYVIVSILLLQAVTIISRNSLTSDKFSEKKGTHWTTLSVLLTQLFMIFTVILETILFEMPVNVNNYIGLVVIIVVLVITFTANKELGEYYSPKIEVKKRHKLIDTGIYAYIRHPMDLASLLLMIALPLAGGALFAYLWFIPYAVLVGFKIRYEEKVLSDGLKGYKAYMKKTKRLIPFIF
ncbi:MAG: isoprenylcysteine carboxylmethyltransferase family protein [Nanoarchaeota archaeon]|nr:isoprenylcysteine carboxylmethyltransferase family protein [Nanoarchaeota archaeon]